MTLHESPRATFGGSWRGERGSVFPPHEHPAWEIVYYRRGRVRAPIGDRTHIAVPGVVLSTPPRTVHSEFAVTAYENIFIVLDAPPTHPWPEVAIDDADRSIERVMAGLERELNAARPDSAQLLGLLSAELDLLLRRAGDGDGADEHPDGIDAVIAAGRQQLDERYAEPIRVADLARNLGLSSSSFRAHFRRVHGCTPRDYLASVRLRHALDHLRHSTHTLDTVARLTGFDSASHLSRHVKAATGATPGSLRR